MFLEIINFLPTVHINRWKSKKGTWLKFRVWLLLWFYVFFWQEVTLYKKRKSLNNTATEVKPGVLKRRWIICYFCPGLIPTERYWFIDQWLLGERMLMAWCPVQPDNFISVWDEVREDTPVQIFQSSMKDWKLGVEKTCWMRKSGSQKQQFQLLDQI